MNGAPHHDPSKTPARPRSFQDTSAPTLLVIAGPNGAGKTTVATSMRLQNAGFEHLNPDEVARLLFGDWNSPVAILKAAQWTTGRCEVLLKRQASIALETVFSTPGKVDFIARAKAAGYFTRVIFIGTSDPRINASRVASRVMEGGHSVPIEKVIARYARAMANLSAVIRVADRVYIYDNSIELAAPRLYARTSCGKLQMSRPSLPAWIAAAVKGLDRHVAFDEGHVD